MDSFNLHHTDADNDPAATDAQEALLASLKAAISHDAEAPQLAHDDIHHPGGQTLNAYEEAHPQQDAAEGQHASGSGVNVDVDIGHGGGVDVGAQGSGGSANPVHVAINKSLATLAQLTSASGSLLEEVMTAGAIQNLAQNLKVLKEGNKRQTDTLKELAAQIKASEMNVDLSFPVSGDIDPDLSPVVLRSEYDALKAQFEALLATGSSGPAPASSTPAGKRTTGRKPRATKASTVAASRAEMSTAVGQPQSLAQGQEAHAHEHGHEDMDDLLRPIAETKPNGQGTVPAGGVEGRKKRSIKLEHLVHKMANRRLGVEYTVSSFESKGGRDLPEPASRPLTAAESPNGVDECRPDFRGDVNATSVKPFIDLVVNDVWEAWPSVAGGTADGEMDRGRVVNAMHIYWTRLAKRYEEQLCRERGEIHRDELSRKKQNTYRRQQSLLARRLAAFDSSPLNACRLRAHYRTLLTIDFAAQTQDAPDPKRTYTVDEWHAYRRLACGARAEDAHEVIDQFWLSPIVRSLLLILDEFAQDQSNRARRKGKPKQPNPTFHLPSSLWDRSTLPSLRPKDTDGLPVSGAPGIILFKFHVDEQVQRDNPEWARGLYDNPPVPADDEPLPVLSEVMSDPGYMMLRHMVREAKDRANPKVLSTDQVEQVNSHVEVDQLLRDNGDIDNEGHYMATFAALTQLANTNGAQGSSTPSRTATPGPSTFPVDHPLHPHHAHHLHHAAHGSIPSTPSAPHSGSAPPIPPAHNPLGSISGLIDSPVTPYGSSQRARKLGKRTASEFPGGAATPVAKRTRGDGGPAVASTLGGAVVGGVNVGDGGMGSLGEIGMEGLGELGMEEGADVDGVLGGDAEFLDAI
ncbi:hypothetical protein IAT38_006063 [Cryptococcus sp. DSM 104549]